MTMEIQFYNSTTTEHIKTPTKIQTVSDSEAESTDPRQLARASSNQRRFNQDWVMHKLCTL